jgi:hypothetical protein
VGLFPGFEDVAVIVPAQVEVSERIDEAMVRSAVCSVFECCSVFSAVDKYWRELQLNSFFFIQNLSI